MNRTKHYGHECSNILGAQCPENYAKTMGELDGNAGRR